MGIRFHLITYKTCQIHSCIISRNANNPRFFHSSRIIPSETTKVRIISHIIRFRTTITTTLASVTSNQLCLCHMYRKQLNWMTFWRTNHSLKMRLIRHRRIIAKIAIKLRKHKSLSSNEDCCRRNHPSMSTSITVLVRIRTVKMRKIMKIASKNDLLEWRINQIMDFRNKWIIAMMEGKAMRIIIIIIISVIIFQIKWAQKGALCH